MKTFTRISFPVAFAMTLSSYAQADTPEVYGYELTKSAEYIQSSGSGLALSQYSFSFDITVSSTDDFSGGDLYPSGDPLNAYFYDPYSGASDDFWGYYEPFSTLAEMDSEFVPGEDYTSDLYGSDFSVFSKEFTMPDSLSFPTTPTISNYDSLIGAGIGSDLSIFFADPTLGSISPDLIIYFVSEVGASFSIDSVATGDLTQTELIIPMAALKPETEYSITGVHYYYDQIPDEGDEFDLPVDLTYTARTNARFTTAVPEPAHYAAGFGAIALAVSIFRRRMRRKDQ